MMMKRRQMLRLFAFIIVIIIVFALIQSLRDVPTTIVPQQNGNADLSRFDFSKTIVQLAGNIEHFSNELLEPSQMGGLVGEPTKGGAAYGTYRLRIALPDGDYTLGFVSIDYATRVYINGALAQNIGFVGKTKEETTPSTAYVYQDARPESGVIEVVLQYANFQHVSGGETKEFAVGTPALMRARMVHHATYSAILMGCLGVAALLLLGLYLFYPVLRGTLYFAFACLLLALREGTVGDQLLNTLFPGVPWIVGFSAQYISLCLLSVFLVLFINDLYPKLLHKWVRWAVYLLSLAYALMVLLLDSRIYTAYIVWYQGSVQAATIVYIVVRIAMHMRTMTYDQRISVAGMLVFFFGAISDILYFRDIRILPFGIVIHSEVTMIVFIFAQMAALFVRIERDIAEAREKEHLLSVKNETLQMLDKQRAQFLSNVSHELKTPLTVVSGYAQLTRMHAQESGDADAYVVHKMKLVASEADRMAVMVGQLLDISRMDEDRMEWDKKRVDVAELIDQNIDAFYPVLNKNHNMLTAQLPDDLPSVFADRERITQVLVNLLSNAIRFTYKGRITVHAELRMQNAESGTTGFVAISVADTGKGIAQDQLPLLFDRFYSGDEREKSTGTGLGLYISKRIVEAHGGTITANSVLNQGTTMTFTLPVYNAELRIKNAELETRK